MKKKVSPALWAMLAISFLCNSGGLALAQIAEPGHLKKIAVEDFSPKSPVVNDETDAVILADVGSSKFVGNNSGGLSLVYSRSRRVLIRKRTAFDEATVVIPLDIRESAKKSETLEAFDATTYNLENGQIKETRIGKSAILEEKENRGRVHEKFTFPDLKEGSIVEYNITTNSPFYGLRSWNFQEAYPVLWSQYHVVIPSIYKYLMYKQGYLKFNVDSVKKVTASYMINSQRGDAFGSGDAFTSNDTYRVTGEDIWALWAIKDVPAFNREQYLASPSNYKNRIRFQLKSIEYDNEVENKHRIMKTWPEVADALLQDPAFGQPLLSVPGWATDEARRIGGDAKGLQLADRIYSSVRDNYTATTNNDVYPSPSLGEVYRKKSGNVAGVNLMLALLLRAAGFEVQPVLVSTRDYGFANDAIASPNEYNYLLARVKVDTTWYLLDASKSRLGFGKLAGETYNFTGRIIAPQSSLIDLDPGKLKETKVTTLFMGNDEDGGYSGTYHSELGYLESTKLREKINGNKIKDYEGEIRKSYVDAQVSSFSVDSLEKYQYPLAINYEVKLKFDGGDQIYFSPMMIDAVKKNPFAAADRKYPVDMNSLIDETYILNMEIPKGYKVDELPKSTRIKLNLLDGGFDYVAALQGNKVQVMCHTTINKVSFDPAEYQNLRAFYSFIATKEAEQIVFKKIQ